MEVYLHPLRKPPKAGGDISRVLLILPLSCLVFIRHFMFIKHKDLWSSPPSLVLGEGKGSQQRRAAGDGDTTGGRARDIPASPFGGPRPQTQQSSSPGTHPALKMPHGQDTSLLGWVQTPGGSSPGEWDSSEGGCWAAGQTAPGPPWEHPKRWHPMLGNTEVSQGCGPMLSRTKSEIFLLGHPRKRCLRSTYPPCRCGRQRESHPAVCERLPAPTCKNKLGNWDQLPSRMRANSAGVPAPLRRAVAGPTAGTGRFSREKAMESLGCAEQERRRLPLTLTGFNKSLLKARVAPWQPSAEASELLRGGDAPRGLKAGA